MERRPKRDLNSASIVDDVYFNPTLNQSLLTDDGTIQIGNSMDIGNDYNGSFMRSEFAVSRDMDAIRYTTSIVTLLLQQSKT